MLNYRIFIKALIAILLLTNCRFANQPDSDCDETTARLVARAYVLSVPFFGRESELIPFLAENETYFVEDGKAIRCMQALGEQLCQAGAKELQQNNSRTATEIYGGSMPQGLESLPGQVDASMQSYSSNIGSMGLELIWLSQVLPPATRGDYGPYNNAGTPARQSVPLYFQILNMLCQLDYALCQQMQNMVMEKQPDIEEQIYLLARQYNN